MKSGSSDKNISTFELPRQDMSVGTEGDQCLRHIVNEDGLKPQEQKVDVIRRLPQGRAIPVPLAMWLLWKVHPLFC